MVFSLPSRPLRYCYLRLALNSNGWAPTPTNDSWAIDTRKPILHCLWLFSISKLLYTLVTPAQSGLC